MWGHCQLGTSLTCWSDDLLPRNSWNLTRRVWRPDSRSWNDLGFPSFCPLAQWGLEIQLEGVRPPPLRPPLREWLLQNKTAHVNISMTCYYVLSENASSMVYCLCIDTCFTFNTVCVLSFLLNIKLGAGWGGFNTRPLSMKNSIVWIERADTWCRGEWAQGLAGDLALLPTSHFPRLPLSIIPSFQFHSSPPFKMPHACNFSLPRFKKKKKKEDGKNDVCSEWDKIRK